MRAVRGGQQKKRMQQKHLVRFTASAACRQTLAGLRTSCPATRECPPRQRRINAPWGNGEGSGASGPPRDGKARGRELLLIRQAGGATGKPLNTSLRRTWEDQSGDLVRLAHFPPQISDLFYSFPGPFAAQDARLDACTINPPRPPHTLPPCDRLIRTTRSSRLDARFKAGAASGAACHQSDA